jgi:hypothetical protein
VRQADPPRGQRPVRVDDESCHIQGVDTVVLIVDPGPMAENRIPQHQPEVNSALNLNAVMAEILVQNT